MPDSTRIKEYVVLIPHPRLFCLLAFASLPLASRQHEGGRAALADGQDVAAGVTNDPGDDLYGFHAPSIFAARGAK